MIRISIIIMYCTFCFIYWSSYAPKWSINKRETTKFRFSMYYHIRVSLIIIIYFIPSIGLSEHSGSHFLMTEIVMANKPKHYSMKTSISFHNNKTTKEIGIKAHLTTPLSIYCQFPFFIFMFSTLISSIYVY